jgi:RNA polymerase sigma-70 factor (ECF subfamily)
MTDHRPETARITVLLRALGQGEKQALDELMPLVYEQLRQLARRQLSQERTGHTLNSVALVNEAYLRLSAGDEIAWQNRAHFFGVSAKVMRRILVDYARTRNAQKRGGGKQPIPIEDMEIAAAMTGPEAEHLVALDAAIERLSGIDETASQIVEFRFFAGATEEEAAVALGVSPATARRRWAFAKAWLKRELDGATPP